MNPTPDQPDTKPDHPMSPVDAALHFIYHGENKEVNKHIRPDLSQSGEYQSAVILADEVLRLRERNAILRTEAKSALETIRKHNDSFEEAVIERDKLREQTRWRPIDTMPKDHSDFLVFCHHEKGAWNGYFIGFYNERPSKYKLTHWMPLPAAPEIGEKGGDL